MRQNCPQGEKCVAHSPDDLPWSTFKCVPVVRDPNQPGDSCTVLEHYFSGVDTCDKGSTCWHLNTTLEGHCLANCGWDLVCPDDTQYCRLLADSEFAPMLCFQSCDPLAQDGPDDKICSFDEYWNAPFNCYPASGVVGEQLFDDCTPFAYGLCAKGLACLWGTGCVPYCDLTAPNCPGPGLECTPWYEIGEAPVEYENVGVCAPP